MPDDHGTYLLRPTTIRIVLLSVGLSLLSIVFLFMAAVCVAIRIDSGIGRFALTILALLLTALALYFLLLLRTTIIRIEVGPERLKLRLPLVRGPLPLLGTIRADLPYADIVTVDTRAEVYVSFGLVTVQHAYSILTRHGDRILLGVMAENWGAQMPYDEAAARIAARAELPVVDHGAVRVGGILRAMIEDVPPWSAEPMPIDDAVRWRRRAALTMQIILLLVAFTAVLRACARF